MIWIFSDGTMITRRFLWRGWSSITASPPPWSSTIRRGAFTTGVQSIQLLPSWQNGTICTSDLQSGRLTVGQLGVCRDSENFQGGRLRSEPDGEAVACSARRRDSGRKVLLMENGVGLPRPRLFLCSVVICIKTVSPCGSFNTWFRDNLWSLAKHDCAGWANLAHFLC